MARGESPALPRGGRQTLIMTIKGLRRWLPAVAAAAILPLTAASAAAASTHHHHHSFPHTVTAVTHLVHRGDGGGAGNYWAYDYFTRTAKVTFRGMAPLSSCGVVTGHCYAFTARLADRGSFRTIAGQQSPNFGTYPGVLIKRQVKGSFHGYGLFATFYANALPKAGRVPHVVYGNADPSYLWPTLFFPSWAAVVGVNETDYGYYYKAPHHQHWVDGSFNGDGQLPGDGNITG